MDIPRVSTRVMLFAYNEVCLLCWCSCIQSITVLRFQLTELPMNSLKSTEGHFPTKDNSLRYVALLHRPFSACNWFAVFIECLLLCFDSLIHWSSFQVEVKRKWESEWVGKWKSLHLICDNSWLSDQSFYWHFHLFTLSNAEKKFNIPQKWMFISEFQVNLDLWILISCHFEQMAISLRDSTILCHNWSWKIFSFRNCKFILMDFFVILSGDKIRTQSVAVMSQVALCCCHTHQLLSILRVQIKPRAVAKEGQMGQTALGTEVEGHQNRI